MITPRLLGSLLWGQLPNCSFSFIRHVFPATRGDNVIIGTHLISYSVNADADRQFFQDVLQFGNVDAGQGWLIFALPPSEIAFHPGEEEKQELYLLCDELDATMTQLKAKGVQFDPPTEARWGRVTYFALPSGTRVGLYQPYHPLAIKGEM